MADQKDLEFTYSLIDKIFRLSLGEMADFSGAKYDGDFSLTLEEAQRRKHEYVAAQIGIDPGRRVLDLGCGWGPLLNFIRGREATGIGVTLSSAQAEACRRNGLDARIEDARAVTATPSATSTRSPASAPSSTSARSRSSGPGARTRSTRDLFANLAGMLPDGGRLYLQTMVFGRNMIDPDEASIDAPRDSDAWYLALMQRQFPGSFLPFGKEQIVAAAEPHFRLVEAVSGRLDYIETIRQWRKRFGEPSLRKTLLKARLVPHWLTSSDFRLAFTSGREREQRLLRA